MFSSEAICLRLRNQIEAIESLLKNLGLDAQKLEICELTSACVRLGRLIEEKERRDRHYDDVNRVNNHKHTLANVNEGRSEINRARKQAAQSWHRIAEAYIESHAEDFTRKTKAAQARLIQKELKRNDMTAATGTIENYLRQRQKKPTHTFE